MLCFSHWEDHGADKRDPDIAFSAHAERGAEAAHLGCACFAN